jgi:hypothetical protein
VNDPFAYVGTVVAGGGVLLAIVLIIFLVVRHAIATAVQHAANREMATLQSKFAEQLEDKRQQFARDLARERELAEKASAEAQRAFTKEMERYKADLLTGAETRRQIVTRRLQAIDAIYKEAIRLITAVRTRADLDRGERIDMENHLYGLIREQSHLLDGKFLGEVSVIVGSFVEAGRAIKEGRGTAEHAKTLNDFHIHLAARMSAELAAMSRAE